MQAALMLRAKSRERRKQRLKRGIKQELPSNVATKTIAPFPRYPPASWCSAGRAAWQEAAALSVGGGGAGAGGAARRCSVLGDHPGARRDPRAKWHRNNRVRDASCGSSSDSDGEFEGASGEPWGVARLLYAGLGILAVGLVVYFVGTGDKGFKTPALRLVGPSLIIAGLACCLLRITFCIFAKPCCRRRTNYKESRRLSECVEGEEMPLAGAGVASGGGGGVGVGTGGGVSGTGGGGSRLGPAQCSPARRLDASSCDVSSLSSGEEDERLRRYRTASLHPTPLPLPMQQVTVPQNAAQRSPSPQSTVQHSGVQQNVLQQSALQQSALQHSGVQQNVLQQSALQQSALQHSGVQNRALQQSVTLPSALYQSAGAGAGAGVAGGAGGARGAARRPPPRNVSFAGGPDGELVLSPAQLRS